MTYPSDTTYEGVEVYHEGYNGNDDGGLGYIAFTGTDELVNIQCSFYC